MEFLTEMWDLIAPYVAGVSVSGVLAGIIFLALRSAFNSVVNKINVEKISKDTIEKSIGQVKEISFKQTLEPIAKSELEKINEKANERLEENFVRLEDKYNKILGVLECLANYFDNSITVSEDKKAEMHELIENAKIGANFNEITFDKEIDEESENTQNSTKEINLR